jgi:hypothetical protein
MSDHSFEDAVADWKADGSEPDEEPTDCYCRPEWPEDAATHYQAYENVSEGTPVSPVFATTDELIEWMVQPIDRLSPFNRGADWQCMQGRTREQAEYFADGGYAPSMVLADGRLMDGVTAGPVIQKPKDPPRGAE